MNDYENDLPLKHKKDWQPETIPSSLKEAVHTFILSRSVRLLRGQTRAHNSMLINVSRFTAVQSQIKLLADEWLKETRQAIVNHCKLPPAEALENSIMAALKSTFEDQFSRCGFTWADVQPLLKDAVSPISVIEVNSSSAAQPLDYDRLNYPDGRNLIAVGGMNLSRGLTLEGLTVSYFLRNSVMYDTLMQMGRWFGYRDGYDDLCRIYMTAEAESWYSHISEATDELREEFRRMKAAGMTPADFGLCVRSHPDSLIVTARNKMRTGKKVVRSISLEGRLVETSILINTPQIIQQNFAALEQMVRDAESQGQRTENGTGYLWRYVPGGCVSDFVERFQNHWASQLTEKGPLKEYISWLETQGVNQWDVVLVSPKDAQKVTQAGDFRVSHQERKVTRDLKNDKIIALNKRRVASRGIERTGLPKEVIDGVKRAYTGKNIPDLEYRKLRQYPLLMLHILDCRLDGISLSDQGIVAYGISFPGEAGSRKPRKLVEYVVTTVWWRNEFIDSLDEEENFEVE